MEVEINKLDHFGRGICYIKEKICFVEGALPNEKCEIEIIKEDKKMIEASLTSIKTKSSSRVSPTCPYADTCGGCTFQHLKYEEENKYKETKIKEILSKFGNISSDVLLPIVSLEDRNYRNKIVLHGKDGLLGLYKNNSHEIIPITSCELVLPKINEIIEILNDINQNIEESTIKCSNDQNEVLVDIKGKVKDIDILKDKCDVLIYNGKVISTKSSIKTRVGDCYYYQSSSSFFQVNAYLTEYLYNAVREIIKDEKPKNVLDLYTGTGTIAIYNAKNCDSIIGIDYNESNIKDANKNLELNNLTNISLICDKVENQIDKFNNIDIVIVDPPRSGLDSKTKEYLKKISSSKIIYVSCDPVTLARDLKELNDIYKVKSVQPFNMFPKTYHCESVCLLERR